MAQQPGPKAGHVLGASRAWARGFRGRVGSKRQHEDPGLMCVSSQLPMWHRHIPSSLPMCVPSRLADGAPVSH